MRIEYKRVTYRKIGKCKLFKKESKIEKSSGEKTRKSIISEEIT